MKSENIHYTHNYLLNPFHPVTVTILGAGGTGGQVLQRLARIHVALVALGHIGLDIRLWDDDIIEESNLARQLFTYNDIGRNKAVVLIERMNRFYGIDWKAIPNRFCHTYTLDNYLSNIMITCTDTIVSRKQLFDVVGNNINETTSRLATNKNYYWLDFGNMHTVGQCIIGQLNSEVNEPNTLKLKTVNELYQDYFNQEEVIAHSCSIAESLDKQDLFINSMLAEFGCNMLWKMFREACISYQGVFVNLETTEISKILIK